MIGERHAGEHSPQRILYLRRYKDLACSLAALYNEIIPYSILLTAMSHLFDDDGYFSDGLSPIEDLDSDIATERQREAGVRALNEGTVWVG